MEIHLTPKALKKLNKQNITVSKTSGQILQLLPVCQSCVDIADSDQWVQVEPSVCRGEGGTEFRISTPAGRFQCCRTRMRWVCDGDVTLHYRAVDGHFLNAELERLQCERVAPVLDVNVISGKLEEAHLPHYMCLAESDLALTNTVKLLSKRDEGISVQSVELSRYHAKICQPSFSLITLIINWIMKWEAHCNLLLYMRRRDPLILHVYFFPVNDSCSKERVEQNERSSLLISHPRPNRPFRMKTPHLLEVPGASVHPVEGISFRTDFEPNFFKVRNLQDDDVQMNLIREEDKVSVWTATIWKDEFVHLKQVQDERQLNSEIEALFVDDKLAELIQRVTAVMAIADELKTKDIIHGEKYDEIKAAKTNQEKMRGLFESLNSGGDDVKRDFYYLLEKHEPHLFKDLGGVNRKRKQDENLDDPVPSKRLNTGSNNHYTHNYNNASTSAAEPAPTYIVNNIVNQHIPPTNMDNVANTKHIVMASWTPASNKEKKHSAPIQKKPKKVNKPPKKEKKSPAPKKDEPPAPKKEKKSPVAKKEKKPPVSKKDKPPTLKTETPPAPKKVNKPHTSKKNKPPASKIENKSPAPKRDKPPAPKKEKKPPAPKKEKKPPAPKKEKKPPSSKKEKKPPAPKKEKKPPAPKKKKPPAPKKQKPPAPKKQKPPAHK